MNQATSRPAGRVLGFLGNLSVYAFVSLFNRGIALATIPLVAAYIGGVEAYGVKEYIEFLIVLLATTSQGEIVQALVRFLSGRRSEIDEAKVIWSAAAFLCLTGAVVVPPVLLWSGEVSWLLFDSARYADAVVCGVLIVFFSAFFRMALSVLEARQEARHYAVFALSKTVFEVTLKLLLLIGLDLGYMAVLLPVLVAECLFGAVAFARIAPRQLMRPDTEWLRRLLAFSLPVLATNLCMLGVHQIDRVFLMEFAGLVATGLYGLAWKLGSIVNAVLFAAFGRAWFPAVFAIEAAEARNEFARRTSMLFMALACGVSLVAMLSGDLVMLILPTEYAGALPLMRLVLFGYLFWFLYQIFSMPLFLHLRTRQVFAVSILGLICNAALNAILVPAYGAVGAALATVASYFLLAVMIDLMARRAENIAFDRPRLYGLVLLSGAIFLVWLLLDRMAPGWPVLVVAGFAGVGLFLLAVLGLSGLPAAELWRAGRVALKGR